MLVAAGAVTVFLMPLLASITYRVADAKPLEAVKEIAAEPARHRRHRARAHGAGTHAGPPGRRPRAWPHGTGGAWGSKAGRPWEAAGRFPAARLRPQAGARRGARPGCAGTGRQAGRRRRGREQGGRRGDARPHECRGMRPLRAAKPGGQGGCGRTCRRRRRGTGGEGRRACYRLQARQAQPGQDARAEAPRTHPTARSVSRGTPRRDPPSRGRACRARVQPPHGRNGPRRQPCRRRLPRF